MAKNTDGKKTQKSGLSGFLSDRPDDWQDAINAVALRFNKEYQGDAFDLPEEVKAMPIFQERASGLLAAKSAFPFWELAKPQKNQHCLDIGCGVSFLIYPWRDWEAYFHGVEISQVARDLLTARGPQLNSKLYKGVEMGAAHALPDPSGQYDLAIATGFSCYYPLPYWAAVLDEVKRVLKPNGVFVFDVLDPETPLAENWAILETYLGAEVFLEPLTAWQTLIKDAHGQILKRQAGELFHGFKVRF